MKPSVTKGIKSTSQTETAPPRSKPVGRQPPTNQPAPKTPTSMDNTSAQAGRLMTPRWPSLQDHPAKFSTMWKATWRKAKYFKPRRVCNSWRRRWIETEWAVKKLAVKSKRTRRMTGQNHHSRRFPAVEQVKEGTTRVFLRREAANNRETPKLINSQKHLQTMLWGLVSQNQCKRMNVLSLAAEMPTSWKF